jgi:LysM repeat protein
MRGKQFLLVFLVLVLLCGAPGLPASAAQNASLTCTMYHTVKGGETLEKIANKYKVSTGWLALINGLSGDKVQPEHKLCVQLTDTAKLQAACTQVHIVQRGEDLTKIANLYGVTVGSLIAINGLTDPDHLYAGNRICIQNATPSSSASSSASSVIPTFSINSEVKNQTVTIQTYNFPANKTFDVLMGGIGTQAINGISAGAVNTNGGGYFVVTFEIPAALKGLSQIAIRLEANDSSGFFAYNWFYNQTTP